MPVMPALTPYRPIAIVNHMARLVAPDRIHRHLARTSVDCFRCPKPVFAMLDGLPEPRLPFIVTANSRPWTQVLRHTTPKCMGREGSSFQIVFRTSPSRLLTHTTHPRALSLHDSTPFPRAQSSCARVSPARGGSPWIHGSPRGNTVRHRVQRLPKRPPD
jgi:hypothetical protein